MPIRLQGTVDQEWVSDVDWNFGDLIWSMLVFFFWFTLIWMFIATFADIFRRHDVSGWAKAGWILLIVVLPFLGILIYVISRPRMLVRQERVIPEPNDTEWPVIGRSTAEEIEKLAKLKGDGTISEEEYQTLKRRVLVA